MMGAWIRDLVVGSGKAVCGRQGYAEWRGPARRAQPTCHACVQPSCSPAHPVASKKSIPEDVPLLIPGPL